MDSKYNCFVAIYCFFLTKKIVAYNKFRNYNDFKELIGLLTKKWL